MLLDIHSPLQALSKLVPVPESLMSPDYRPSPLINKVNAHPTGLVLPNRSSSAKVISATKSPKASRITSCKAKLAYENKKNNIPTTPKKKTQQSTE